MKQADFEAILDASIKLEEQSYSLYKTAKEKVDYESSKQFLEELASEELTHKKKLLAIKQDRSKLSELGFQTKKVQDLQIVDAMKDARLSKDADYQRILTYAAKREKATHDYYHSIALGLEGTELGELFSRLAQEEMLHKNRLEREYDDVILKDN